MKTVLVDMDGILVDLTGHWLKQIHQDHDVLVHVEEINQWSLHKCGGLVDLGVDKVHSYLRKEGFFRHAPPLPGAIDGLRALHDAGFNTVICSSPSGGVSAKEKFEWLAEHAPFVKEKNIILANQKTLIRGDVLVDDHPETGLEYRKAWPSSLVVGIEYEYNRHVRQDARLRMFEGYRESARAWGSIVHATYEHMRLL